MGVERASWAQPQDQRPIPAAQTSRRRRPSSPIPRQEGIEEKPCTSGCGLSRGSSSGAVLEWPVERARYAAQFTVGARFLAPDASAAVLGSWNRLLKPRKPLETGSHVLGATGAGAGAGAGLMLAHNSGHTSRTRMRSSCFGFGSYWDCRSALDGPPKQHRDTRIIQSPQRMTSCLCVHCLGF